MVNHRSRCISPAGPAPSAPRRGRTRALAERARDTHLQQGRTERLAAILASRRTARGPPGNGESAHAPGARADGECEEIAVNGAPATPRSRRPATRTIGRGSGAWIPKRKTPAGRPRIAVTGRYGVEQTPNCCGVRRSADDRDARETSGGVRGERARRRAQPESCRKCRGAPAGTASGSPFLPQADRASPRGFSHFAERGFDGESMTPSTDAKRRDEGSRDKFSRTPNNQAPRLLGAGPEKEKEPFQEGSGRRSGRRRGGPGAPSGTSRP